MGLLKENDWTADYISYRDDEPVDAKTGGLYLSAARQYQKPIAASKTVRRATLYAIALGDYELHLNGHRVGDAYYNTYDLTNSLQPGDNAIGAWVADGWYSGYVGFGLLTGMGTEKTGRATYGKTRALMAQLELEFFDGSRQVIGTDLQNDPDEMNDLAQCETYGPHRE